MILNKALLLKCLGGVAACTGVAGVGIWGSQHSGRNNNDSSESGLKLNELIAKVGLTTCTTTDSGSNECDIGTTGLKVKQGSNSEENKTKDTTNSASTGKIKVYSDSNYENKFKFVIEEGDIALTGGTGTVTKLEQFETYEIKQDSDKWYFSRKKKAGENIKESLGLPSDCNLVENNTCSSVSLDATKLKAINFEGKSDSSQASLGSNASVTLSISKETTDTDVYTGGYKFSFTTGNTGDVTIPGSSGSITLKSNTTTEFKIKKTGNKLTLEKAWTLETLAAKVGLNCTSDTDSSCTQKTSGTTTTNIKHDNVTHDSKTLTISNSTKIKVHKETSGYNEGFKFVIEGGDVTFNTDKKLEEGDTYEIKKENNKWYLSRKTESVEKQLSKALGLPDGCKLPKTDNTSTSCENINAEKLKKINFDGKNESGTWTIGSNGETITLKITKTSDTTTFTKGYKFAFEGDKDISIPLSSGDPITLKKNTNTEFKVKNGNGGDDSNLTLEKAWTPQELLKKVQVTGTCTSNGNKQCSLEGKINVFNSNDAYVTGASFGNGSENKKITYEEDQEGHNQGIKFTVTEEICLTGGTSSGTEVNKIENTNVSYEIKETSGTWYLTKKANTQ